MRRDSGLELMLVFLVEFAMELLTATGRGEPAAVLLGALDAETLGTVASVMVIGLVTFDATAVQIRASVPATQCAAAEARGAAMDRRAIVAFALDALAD